MRKSLNFFVSKEINDSKNLKISELENVYYKQLQENINLLIEKQRASIDRTEYSTFFSKETDMSYSISLNCKHHAASIIKSWSSSGYACIKRQIKFLSKTEKITKEFAHALFTIGKTNIGAPVKIKDLNVTQEHIDYYWKMLLDKCNKPVIKSPGVYLNDSTGVFKTTSESNHFKFWIAVSCLTKGSRVFLPLEGNPNFTSREELVNDFLLLRDKQSGRLYINICEKKKYLEPKSSTNKVVGIDVGKNIPAATSDGRLYGEDIKNKYNIKYGKIKKIHAQNQSKGVIGHSKRVAGLEANLKGYLKSEMGRIANQISMDYADCSLAMEKLDLRDLKGDFRFCYAAIKNSLSSKMPIVEINPAYTSQECPDCGYICKKNRSGIKFNCRCCGSKRHADVVGAINIARRSSDPSIGVDDDSVSVGELLKKRYRENRNYPLFSRHISSKAQVVPVKKSLKRVVNLQPKELLIKSPQRPKK